MGWGYGRKIGENTGKPAKKEGMGRGGNDLGLLHHNGQTQHV